MLFVLVTGQTLPCDQNLKANEPNQNQTKPNQNIMITTEQIRAANAATAAEHSATAAFWAAEFETSGSPEDSAKAEFYRRLAEEHEAYASPAIFDL